MEATLTASIGVWFLAGSTEAWFGGKLSYPLRVLMFVAAILMIHPGTVMDVIGLAIGVPVYLWQRMRQSPQPA